MIRPGQPRRPHSAVGQGSSMLDPVNNPSGSAPTSSPLRQASSSAKESDSIKPLDLYTHTTLVPAPSAKAKVTLVGRNAPFTAGAGGPTNSTSSLAPAKPERQPSGGSPSIPRTSSPGPAVRLVSSTVSKSPSPGPQRRGSNAIPMSSTAPVSSPISASLSASAVSSLDSPSPSPAASSPISASLSVGGPITGSSSAPSLANPAPGTVSMRGVVKMGPAQHHGSVGGPARFVDFVSPDVLSSLSKDERERQEVIFEMIKTEKQYIADMNLVVKLFLNPIRDKELLNKQSIAALFSNIEALIGVNQKLLDEFELRQKQNPVVEKIGEVFATHGDMLKLYAIYCSNQPLIPQTIAQLSKQSSSFDKLLKECAVKPECRAMLLTDFLIQPMQRVCKYPLLLKSILKATPPEHSDYGHLVAGLQIVEKVVTQVNARTKQVENVLKLKEIQAKLVFPKDRNIDLVAHDRYFAKEGPTKILRAEKKGGKETLKDYYLFLLSDMLLLGLPLPQRKPGKDGPYPPQYQVDKIVPLFEPNTANIVEVTPIDSGSLEVKELDKAGGGKIKMEFGSETDRDAWQTGIEAITFRYADNWNRNVKRFSMFTRESNEVAPKGRPTISVPKAAPKSTIVRDLGNPSATIDKLEKRVQELEEEVRTLKQELDEERQYYLQQIQELNDQLLNRG